MRTRPTVSLSDNDEGTKKSNLDTTMSPNVALVSLLGAVLLLVYGINLAGEALQRIAGHRLRQLLLSLGENRLAALGAGALVAALLQSSSATAMMLVGFARAGLIEMRQTIGLILGADIGSTLIVQLLAFRVYDYALLLVAVGVALLLSSRRRVTRDVGQAVLGFGLVFLALRIIIESMSPLRDNLLVRELFLGLADVPLLALLLAALLAAVTTSSAATIGIALVLAADGILPLGAAVPIVLGANVGTAAAAFVASVGGNPEGRRVATAHLLFKVVGAALFFPFTAGIADLAGLTALDPARQVAMIHTGFNLAIAGLFLPLSHRAADLVRWLVPEVRTDETFKTKYLDEYVLESPPLALGQATMEVLRMADIVQDMVRDTLRVFRDHDEPLLEEIERSEDRVDYLEEAIKSYLTALSQQALTEEQSRREIGLIYVISELEHTGDVVDKSLMPMARKMIDGRLRFSTQGMQELETLHRRVVDNLRSAVTAIATMDPELAQRVLRERGEINKMERELQEAHIGRLHAGAKESVETSSIHMDVLNDLRRINSHAAEMAFVVLGEL